MLARVLAAVVLSAACTFVLSAAQPAGAHFQSYEYTAKGCPVSDNPAVDPVNVVFWNKADNGRTQKNIEYHTGWGNHSGSKQYFSSHDVCGEMSEQIANGGVDESRFHIRIKKTYHSDDDLGVTSRGDAHHEDFVLCTEFPYKLGHAVDKNGDNGSGFDQGRNRIRAYFDGDPGHPWYSKYWGNTRNFKQCDGDYAGSDGYTVFIKLPHDH